MNHVLENPQLKIEVSEAGAELQSIFLKENQMEYLWQGMPAYWPRKAPVLFPIVGKLKENRFFYDNHPYSLPQHGFARDKHFHLKEASEHSLLFRLEADEDTRRHFPFEFILEIRYTIQERSVSVHYTVMNPSEEKELVFSIGAHPGFNCPLTKDTRFEDYYLEFEKAEPLDRILLDGGLRSSRTERIPTDGNRLPLTPDLFSVKDAIVVKGLKSNRISLKSDAHTHGIHFTYDPCIWFGIWSKPGPFVCLEPWMGVADDLHSDHQITKKEGIQHLKPGKDQSYGYSVEVF